MSEYALRRAIVADLESYLSKGAFTVVAQDWPEPPPGFPGLLFIAVHPGPTTGTPFGERSTGHDENYTVKITVSQKTGWLPADRRGPVTALRIGLHCSYYVRSIYRRLCYITACNSIIAAANAILDADEPARTSGIDCGRFRLVVASENVRKFGYWFGFQGTGMDAQEFTGVASQIILTGAGRRMDPRYMT